MSKALRLTSEPRAGGVKEMWCAGEDGWFLRAGGRDDDTSTKLSSGLGTRELSSGVAL